jgi:hypothetical protein
MCEYLSDTGSEVIIIDNNSTYPPLVEWYHKCGYKVYLMEKNYGHLVYWKSGLVDEYKDRFYFVTDHDLDLSGVPYDYSDVLMKGLMLNPGVTKSGLSLRLDDLPENDYTKKVIDWEGKFWLNKKGSFYPADIDTTFALYDRERDFKKLPPEGNKFFHAVRSEAPYSARHLFWYETMETISKNPEEIFYQENTNTYWSEKMKETWSL